MKKVYVLYDRDGECILAASKTKRALHEFECDMFMNEYRMDMQQAVDEHWINMENPSEEDRAFARDTWNSIMTYFKQYIFIQKVELI